MPHATLLEEIAVAEEKPKVERRKSTQAERDQWYRETLRMASIATRIEKRLRRPREARVAVWARRFRTSKET
jgi:hypothetical protein